MPTKTKQQRLLQYERQQPIEILIRRGVEAGDTLEEVAQDLGVSRNTLYRWLQAMGAEIRINRTVVFPHDSKDEE